MHIIIYYIHRVLCPAYLQRDKGIGWPKDTLIGGKQLKQVISLHTLMIVCAKG